MSKRTLFLIFALFIITSVLLVVAVYNPNSKPTTVQITPTPEKQVAQTVLLFGELSVATSSSVSNLSYSFPINISTGKNKVTAVQLEMQYDPKVLTNVSVAPGLFFKNPVVLLNQIDVKTGRISYALGINPQDQTVAGQGIPASLNFTAKMGAPQETAIIFLPKTLVTAEGTNESVLKLTNSATFTVGIVPSITPSARQKPF